MSDRPNVLHLNAPGRRSEILHRYSRGSIVRYTAEGRSGVVLDVDTEAKRLLLKRAEVREGEWERIAVPVIQVEQCQRPADRMAHAAGE